MKYRKYGDENHPSAANNGPSGSESFDRFRRNGTSGRPQYKYHDSTRKPIIVHGNSGGAPDEPGKPRVISPITISKSIFVGNVPLTVGPYNLKKVFRQYGP